MVGPPLLAPFHDPEFRLGTDMLGRDVAAGLVHGARISLIVRFTATLTALLIGVGVGATAGYAGGWIDDALTHLTEIFQTIPNFIFVILLVVILRSSLFTIVFAIAMVSWPNLARPRSRRGDGTSAAGVCSIMPDHRDEPPAGRDHPDPAQLLAADPGHRLDHGRDRDPGRSRAVLFWGWAIPTR